MADSAVRRRVRKLPARIDIVVMATSRCAASHRPTVTSRIWGEAQPRDWRLRKHVTKSTRIARTSPEGRSGTLDLPPSVKNLLTLLVSQHLSGAFGYVFPTSSADATASKFHNAQPT